MNLTKFYLINIFKKKLRNSDLLVYPFVAGGNGDAVFGWAHDRNSSCFGWTITTTIEWRHNSHLVSIVAPKTMRYVVSACSLVHMMHSLKLMTSSLPTIIATMMMPPPPMLILMILTPNTLATTHKSGRRSWSHKSITH